MKRSIVTKNIVDEMTPEQRDKVEKMDAKDLNRNLFYNVFDINATLESVRKDTHFMSLTLLVYVVFSILFYIGIYITISGKI